MNKIQKEQITSSSPELVSRKSFSSSPSCAVVELSQLARIICIRALAQICANQSRFSALARFVEHLVLVQAHFTSCKIASGAGGSWDITGDHSLSLKDIFSALTECFPTGWFLFTTKTASVIRSRHRIESW